MLNRFPAVFEPVLYILAVASSHAESLAWLIPELASDFDDLSKYLGHWETAEPSNSFILGTEARPVLCLINTFV
jgi:hypothetical protein